MADDPKVIVIDNLSRDLVAAINGLQIVVLALADQLQRRGLLLKSALAATLRQASEELPVAESETTVRIVQNCADALDGGEAWRPIVIRGGLDENESQE